MGFYISGASVLVSIVIYDVSLWVLKCGRFLKVEVSTVLGATVLVSIITDEAISACRWKVLKSGGFCYCIRRNFSGFDYNE